MPMKWVPALMSSGLSVEALFERIPELVARLKEDAEALKLMIQKTVAGYRTDYTKYYDAHATKDSPKLRDTNPSVVVVPGLGIFGFGKNKKEARITTEFFINAIHVMEGANALEEGPPPSPLPTA